MENFGDRVRAIISECENGHQLTQDEHQFLSKLVERYRNVAGDTNQIHIIKRAKACLEKVDRRKR